MYEQWHPLGLVGIITAFNFPVAVWSWNACIAAICGNISIWKPSSSTPLCGLAVQKICNTALADAGFPEIFYLFNDGHNHLAQRLVEDKRIALVSFTGSTHVGRGVGEYVAQRMGKSLLELGGNNAIIVDEFANLDIAVPGIVFGAVGTAGQRCTTTRRIICHESRMDELKERLVAAYSQVRIGDPLDSNTLMGPLIDEKAMDCLDDAIASVKKAGGEILYGGKRLDGPGNFVEPVIAMAQNEWDIVQEETFGPILYLISYKDLDEAISYQNGVVQGLSSSIFTDNLQHAEYFLSNGGSDCGIANVNIGTSGSIFFPTGDRIAALPTSTLEPPVPRSAVHSAVRRKPAADGKPVLIHGRRICAVRQRHRALISISDASAILWERLVGAALAENSYPFATKVAPTIFLLAL
jgi:aldehyde dehydrogenase (NAD+)